ncbi:unnamed protein product, partial [Tilletia controversa]
MPLNTTTYLTGRGWEGKGSPLDGANGRGLKKPIVIPHRKNLAGLGRDRDRADEWWDCVFQTGAQSLLIGQKKEGESAAKEKVEEGVLGGQKTTPSLISRARREHVRKMLMSNFHSGGLLESTLLGEESQQ